jgi:hypothetical protein
MGVLDASGLCRASREWQQSFVAPATIAPPGTLRVDERTAVLTVHHLGKSQSERIVWLCEEFGVDYELKLYVRDAATMLSPPELKALHPLGAAPVLADGAVRLA